MSHRITLDRGQKVAAIVTVALIPIVLLFAFWPKDSEEEIKVALPTVVTTSYLSTYGCGASVRVVAPVGRWSREIPERIGCDFSFERDPLPQASTEDRLQNWRGLTMVRVNGDGGPEKLAGQLPDGRFLSAYFEEPTRSMAFRSEEALPIYLIVQYLPK